MENIFDLNSLVAVCVILNRYAEYLAQRIFLMLSGSSTVRLEMEHHNFDNETNEETKWDLHGFCVERGGGETRYQPWGTHGKPLTDKFLSAFNVSVWLLYTMSGHDLSTNAILELILRLPLPSDVAGHMLLYALRQQHCLPRYEAMFYLKGWCYRCGLAQPEEVQTPAETMVSQTSLVLVRPTLASALVHLGFRRRFVAQLPNSIGAVNRTLWRGNCVLVPVCRSALREVHALKTQKNPLPLFKTKQGYLHYLYVAGWPVRAGAPRLFQCLDHKVVLFLLVLWSLLD